MSKVLTCGVDEAGRGPLAGPVYAAAVVLPVGRRMRGLKDSKQLTAEARQELEARIKERAIVWAVAHATVEEIDTINILRASLLAMKRALEQVWAAYPAAHPRPEHVLIDGLHCPPCEDARMRAIVGGDDSVAEISAASILAKTARDAVMVQLHEEYPHYGFDRHKGYSTADHLHALETHGACPYHRRSFEPVRLALQRVLFISA